MFTGNIITGYVNNMIDCMARKQITVTIDEVVLDKFKKMCDDNDINMSKRIERYMKKDLEVNK